MASVQYDDSAFYLLVLALLCMYLVPATIAFCYWECSRPAYKPGRTDSEARRKANTPSLNRFKTFWFAVYLAAWALLIFLLLLEDVVKVDEAAFNPFEILGVEEGAEEDQIKKAYREKSKRWHPDKNPGSSEDACALIGHTVPCNEAAEEMFIRISKANDALTDPATRENYEKYGNPDGRQAMTGSIGLPEFFMDESKWQLILLAYFGAMIFGLPIVVWRWWSNTEQFHGAFKVMNKTMQHYYTKVNEATRVKAMPSILACAAEYSEIPIQPTDQEDLSKLLNAPELAELKLRVKSKFFLVPFVSFRKVGQGAAPADKTRMEYVIRKKVNLTKSMILLHAWLARLEFPRPELETAIHDIVKEAPRLLQALIDYCLQRRWLQPILASLELCQCIVQQLAPWDSARGRDLLQLPHFGQDQIKHCASKSNKVFSTKQFIEKTPEERASIMRTFTESEIADVEAAIAVMPHFDIEYQAFVKGDDDDVASQLFDLCLAEEKKMKGEVTEDDDDEEQDDDDAQYIPEDDDDEGPRHLPWESVGGVKGVKDILLDSNLGFQPEHVKTALEEMELNEDGTIDYSKFVKIAAKQVLKIHAMDLVTIHLQVKMHQKGQEEVSCPNYPHLKRCAWYAILADPNHNRIMDFKRIGNIAEAKPEALQLMWMPDKQGKYELEVYIKTDSYGGLDVRFPMSLKVLKKKEDDIKQQQDAIENDYSDYSSSSSEEEFSDEESGDSDDEEES